MYIFFVFDTNVLILYKYYSMASLINTMKVLRQHYYYYYYYESLKTTLLNVSAVNRSQQKNNPLMYIDSRVSKRCDCTLHKIVQRLRKIWAFKHKNAKFTSFFTFFG